MPKHSEVEQLINKASAFVLDLKDETWFEFMHWHPDIRGIGNQDVKTRAECTRIARTYLDACMQSLLAWSKPSECWCMLDASDSSQDAVYVHTENPNRQNFPCTLEQVTWGNPVPAWVSQVFPSPQYLTGCSGTGKESLYWVIANISSKFVNIEIFARAMRSIQTHN